MNLLLRDAHEALLQRSQRLRAYARDQAVGGGGPALSESEQWELGAIEEALARIAEGRFGWCARCGGAMGRHRLRAVPEARHCLACTNEVGR